MANYEKLEVWREAYSIALDIHRRSRTFPRDEVFLLIPQIRRSAMSIAANIAEGAGRGSDASFRNFTRIAIASANETEHHLRFARDLGYIRADTYDNLEPRIRRVRRMLSGLVKRLGGDGGPTGSR